MDEGGGGELPLAPGEGGGGGGARGREHTRRTAVRASGGGGHGRGLAALCRARAPLLHTPLLARILLLRQMVERVAQEQVLPGGHELRVEQVRCGGLVAAVTLRSS